MPDAVTNPDHLFAQRLKDECATGDVEADGCHADDILDEVLRSLGYTATADAYKDLHLWRA